MKLIRCVLAIFVMYPALATMAQADGNTNVLFTMQGSNTVGAKLAPSCASSFLESLGAEKVEVLPTEVENEFLVQGVKMDEGEPLKMAIHISAHGSSTGFQGLIDKSAAIAMSSRPIKDEEVNALAASGDMRSESSEHTIAIDGLAVLVNSSNPVSELTVTQIRQIFSGQIKNWSAVGGPNLDISIHARDERSGTWETFNNLVLQGQATLAAGAQRYESNDVLSDAVAQDRSAIGFSGLASVRNAKLLAVSDHGTPALLPNEFTVATEDYLLSRRLYMYVPQSRTGSLAFDFIDYCHSERGQEIVSKVGFVSQNIQAVSLATQSHWPDQYKALAANAKRLAVNFRFDEGSAQLDSKARRDIHRVAQYLHQQDGDYELILAGFTDTNEKLKREELISRYRAMAVQAEFIDSRIAVNELLSFGSFMPVASNTETSSKIKNARVEIWVRDKADH